MLERCQIYRHNSFTILKSIKRVVLRSQNQIYIEIKFASNAKFIVGYRGFS